MHYDVDLVCVCVCVQLAYAPPLISFCWTTSPPSCFSDLQLAA